MNHPFFVDINWVKLLKREIRPPFIPQLKNADDVEYFSKEFTDMAPVEGERDRSVAVSHITNWTDFSYTGENNE